MDPFELRDTEPGPEPQAADERAPRRRPFYRRWMEAVAAERAALAERAAAPGPETKRLA